MTTKTTNKTCSEPSCTREVSARGYCKHHYDKLHRFAEGRGGCSVAGCTDGLKARGYCQRHYERYCRKAKKRQYDSTLKRKETPCTTCGTYEALKWYNGPLCRACYNRLPRIKEVKYQYAETYKKWYLFLRHEYIKKLERCTPSWADREELDRIWDNCPPGMHVDHIVPINGEQVSGLNVPWNLQYLPAAENMRKRNKFV